MNFSATTNQTTTLILSLVGVLILFICLVLILTNRAPAINVHQKIKGFGLDMDVSLITILVIVGLVLALSSAYVQLRDFQRDLESIRQENAGLNIRLAHAGKSRVTLLLQLDVDDGSDSLPNPTELYCKYYLNDYDYEGWRTVDTINQGYADEYRLDLDDITSFTNIQKLMLIQKDKKRAWVTQSVGQVLKPSYKLKKTEVPKE